MTDQSIQSINITASPAAIMAVIADFEAYPEWAKSVKGVEILDAGDGSRARLVRFRIDAGVIKDVYELKYSWSGNDAVEWDLVSGQMQKSQHGSYTLRSTDGSTDVTYALSVELAMPMLGMLKRKAERVIMDTALKELKKRVESGG
jgi:ribosome-associated toxin RatA of RatAB toxin-antitoxin module